MTMDVYKIEYEPISSLDDRTADFIDRNKKHITSDHRLFYAEDEDELMELIKDFDAEAQQVILGDFKKHDLYGKDLMTS